MRALEATLLGLRTAPPEDIQAFAPATSGEVLAPERVPDFTIAASGCPLASAHGATELLEAPCRLRAGRSIPGPDTCAAALAELLHGD